WWPPSPVSSNQSSGRSESVRNPCAIVVPNGPSAARCRFVWIHCASSVAAANASTLACVTSSQRLGPSVVPASITATRLLARVHGKKRSNRDRGGLREPLAPDGNSHVPLHGRRGVDATAARTRRRSVRRGAGSASAQREHGRRRRRPPARRGA